MRLFFAAWPDAVAAAELARVAEALAGLAQGKPVPPEKIHLTLAFLGEIDAGAQRSAAEVASKRQVGGPSFPAELPPGVRLPLPKE